MIEQTIIDKIQKLLNLREGAEAVGSLAEAENAASKMQNLLLKHNLSLDQVKEKMIAKKANMQRVVIDCNEKQGKSESDWVTKLYVGIAANNLCRVFHYKGRVQIIGREDNISIVNYMAEQLISKVRIAEKLAFNQYTGDEKRGTFRRGFFTGAAYGISNRLRDDLQKAKAHGNEFAVMIVRNMDEVDEYMYTIWPHMRPPSADELAIRKKQEEEEWANLSEAEKKRRSKPKKIKYSKGPKGLSSNDGYSQGFRAGNAMTINKGVESSTHEKLT